MVYELREYTPTPGNTAVLVKRFNDYTIDLFKKHGMEVVGFWVEELGLAGRVVYMLRYPSLTEREKAWAGFQSDPDWLRIWAETDKQIGGSMVASIQARILRPTPFSPLQ